MKSQGPAEVVFPDDDVRTKCHCGKQKSTQVVNTTLCDEHLKEAIAVWHLNHFLDGLSYYTVGEYR